MHLPLEYTTTARHSGSVLHTAAASSADSKAQASGITLPLQGKSLPSTPSATRLANPGSSSGGSRTGKPGGCMWVHVGGMWVHVGGMCGHRAGGRMGGACRCTAHLLRLGVPGQGRLHATC